MPAGHKRPARRGSRLTAEIRQDRKEGCERGSHGSASQTLARHLLLQLDNKPIADRITNANFGKVRMLFRAPRTAVALALLALFVLHFSFSRTISVAHGRDLGQWDPNDPMTRWFANLMQPDNPKMSCCGESDAYWADEVHIEQDELGRQTVVAVITDDRDDLPLKRIHEDIGTRYAVPLNKITKKDGNPTGHVILFLGANEWEGNRRKRDVVCYVMNDGV